MSMFAVSVFGIVGCTQIHNASNPQQEMQTNPQSEVDEQIDVYDFPEQEKKIYESDNDLSWPISKAADRITKKPFGVYIDPVDSPVQPERFQGYHAGTDFEVFEDELDDVVAVAVKALCAGKVLVRQYVSGYGGVIVQSCYIDDAPVRVLYGHISLNDVDLEVGDGVEVGDHIAFLGNHESAETDYERKHLHVSIVRGDTIDFRGYVDQQEDLDAWRTVETLFDK